MENTEKFIRNVKEIFVMSNFAQVCVKLVIPLIMESVLSDV